MNTIAPSELVPSTGTAREFQWIDVRSAGEYAAGHIPGAVNIPLEQIEARLDDLLPAVPIVLVCQAGKRARMAAGLPLIASVKSRFSLERQVRLIAGLLVLLGVALSFVGQHNWIYLAAVVGAGLIFAGLTDICMMAGLLIRMPWNQSRIKSATAGGQPPCSL